MSKEAWLFLQVLQPVCHTRALQLWTAVYLPTSSPCTAVDDSMELYLPPSAAGEELSSRSLDRWVAVVEGGGRLAHVTGHSLGVLCLQTSQDALHG